MLRITRLVTLRQVDDDPAQVHADSRPNGVVALEHSHLLRQFSWRGPLLMLLVRLPLLLLCFAVALVGARASHQAQPGAFAEGLTRFDLPIVVDGLSVSLLLWLVRREGLRLRDLFGIERAHFARDLVRDLVLGAGLFVGGYVALFAVGIGVMFVTVATASAGQQQALLTSVQGSAGINPLGLGAQIGISALVLPLSTAFAEELIYRGYALPRLQVVTGSRWLAILLTSAGFAMQHVAYGLLSWTSALSGILVAFFAGLLFAILYHVTRQRLLPLVVIHWQTNVISLGLVPIFLAAFVR